MSRAAGLFNKDFNHKCFPARINLKQVSNIDCLNSIIKEKKLDEEQEIIDNLSPNEQIERDNRKDRFRDSPQTEPTDGTIGGFSTAPTNPTGGSDIIFSQSNGKSKLADRFSKPIDTNTER